MARDAEQSKGARTEMVKLTPRCAHTARIWLGGKDHYPVDREVGDQFSAIFPDIIAVARASRAFNARSVRYPSATVEPVQMNCR